MKWTGEHHHGKLQPLQSKVSTEEAGGSMGNKGGNQLSE